MATSSKVALVRAQATLRLDTEDSIQGLQDGQDAIDVPWFAGVNQVYIKRLERSAMKNRSHAAYHDESDFAFIQASQRRK